MENNIIRSWSYGSTLTGTETRFGLGTDKSDEDSSTLPQSTTPFIPSVNVKALESILSAACDSIDLDVVEVWVQTGLRNHQLIHSYIRDSSLDDETHTALHHVYYGDEAHTAYIHKLSPNLCKKAREYSRVINVSSLSDSGSCVLKLSLNGVQTAIAIPLCHETSKLNFTFIYFSMNQRIIKSTNIEFLLYMSLACAISGIHICDTPGMTLAKEDNLTNIIRDNEDTSVVKMNSNVDRDIVHNHNENNDSTAPTSSLFLAFVKRRGTREFGKSSQEQPSAVSSCSSLDHNSEVKSSPSRKNSILSTVTAPSKIIYRKETTRPVSFSDSSGVGFYHEFNSSLSWNNFKNFEYYADGGNNWIHIADLDGKSVIIKQLKPEAHENADNLKELDNEISIHSQLDHNNIVRMYGAGVDRKGNKFIAMERLDGGTLSQLLGYKLQAGKRIRTKAASKISKLPYSDVLNYAQQIARGLDYLHRTALENKMVLHRDLKPDNIGFKLASDRRTKTVKILDFGLSTILDNASAETEEVHELSGEIGSLRYMAPEVAKRLPYNHKADVYSFGILLWQLTESKLPFGKMNRDELFEKVIDGGLRPAISEDTSEEMANLIRSCWDSDPMVRPTCQNIIKILGLMRAYCNEYSEKTKKGAKASRFSMVKFKRKEQERDRSFSLSF